MRDDFTTAYTDAVYEFTEMLVKAGKFIENRPETAAEVAVSFLDPQKMLGLKVPVLKNVLTEAQGIKTGDLLPSLGEIDRMQRYMVEKMGIGALIDVEKFVDLRFAKAACKKVPRSSLPSTLHDTPAKAMQILRRAAPGGDKTEKAMLSVEGKYLVFSLGEQVFGIDIFKIREIIGKLPIRSMPQSPPYIKGVINLRGKVIPVMDLRLRFGMEEAEATERSCIIVLDHLADGAVTNVGVAVDSVTEVLEIKTSAIEDTPFFGAGIDTNYILAMAKTEGGVKILLDMDRLL